MKMNLLYVPVLMAGILSASPRTTTTTTKAPWTTTGNTGLNLNGKMFTLSSKRGGISFYSPNYSLFTTPWPSSHPYTRRPYWTTTRRPYWTTTRRPYRTTTWRPFRTTTRPYRTTTRRPYRTTTWRPFRTTTRPYRTTTWRPYRTTTRRPYRTTTWRPYRTTTRPYRTTTWRPYRTTTRPYRTTTRPYRTTTQRPYTTTTTTQRYTTTYPPRTSPPPTRGVSVCLRYLIDQQQGTYPQIFTLSPSSRYTLRLQARNINQYTLSFGYYYTLNLQTNIRFWSNIGPDIWTRVCLTVDSRKKVAQMFSGTSMSIRKVLPVEYVWTGEPVIDFSGFDGQVTDVQIWDYPLSFTEIISYMANGAYGGYGGSVLTWSNINYSPRGNTLLEDSYEMHAKQPISDCGKGCRTKGEKRNRWSFNAWERERQRQQF